MTPAIEILLISADPALDDVVKEAGRRNPDMTFLRHAAGVGAPVDPAALARAAVVIVQLDATRRDHLLALQSLVPRCAPRPVVVLVDACTDAVQRWFFQIGVRDLMRRPAQGEEIVDACRRLLSGRVDPPSDYAEVISFLPAAGGVGNTTLAIEAAMQILHARPDANSVALVDLDLHSDACADFLDLEPRLDFDEIGDSGERLDVQLLEAMTSRHSSGVALVAAPSVAGQLRDLSSAAILRLLDVVAAQFRHVVIDLPRMWRPWTDGILVGSDRTFIVTDMTVPGLRFARRIADQVNSRLALKDPARVIVNRYERRLFSGAGLRRGDVASALDGIFAGEIANNYQLVREAIDQGVPLGTVKAGNNISTGMRRILFDRAQDERQAS